MKQATTQLPATPVAEVPNAKPALAANDIPAAPGEIERLLQAMITRTKIAEREGLFDPHSGGVSTGDGRLLAARIHRLEEDLEQERALLRAEARAIVNAEAKAKASSVMTLPTAFSDVDNDVMLVARWIPHGLTVDGVPVMFAGPICFAPSREKWPALWDAFDAEHARRATLPHLEGRMRTIAIPLSGPARWDLATVVAASQYTSTIELVEVLEVDPALHLVSRVTDTRMLTAWASSSERYAGAIVRRIARVCEADPKMPRMAQAVAFWEALPPETLPASVAVGEIKGAAE